MGDEQSYAFSSERRGSQDFSTASVLFPLNYLLEFFPRRLSAPRLELAS
jgi:hypothetical protein